MTTSVVPPGLQQGFTLQTSYAAAATAATYATTAATYATAATCAAAAAATWLNLVQANKTDCGPAVHPGFDMSDPVQLAATANPPQVPRWFTQQGGYHHYRRYTLGQPPAGDYLLI